MAKFSFLNAADEFTKRNKVAQLNRATIADGKLLTYFIEKPLSGRDDRANPRGRLRSPS